MLKWSLKNFPRYATGFIAVLLSSVCAFQGRADLTTLAASSFFILVCTTDTFLFRIPNSANFALLLAGMGVNLSTAGASGLLFSFMGLLTGFGLLIVPHLMGGMGAGDVKALAALGALLGPESVFQVFLYTALFGGVLAVMHYALSHNLKEKCFEWATAIKAFAYTKSLDLKPSVKGEQLRFPYAAAIAFGFFANLKWGGLL